MSHRGIITATLIIMSVTMWGQGFLHTEGKRIVNGDGENVILRSIGTGNWMIMEGYMMLSSDIAGTHQQFRDKLTNTIGEVRTDSFYNAWLENHVTRTDIDSMSAWGFNSIRAALHYKWFTPAIEEEPVPGEITWIDKGFELLDSLLDWCGDNRMYLILDLHGAPGGQGKDANISDYDPSKPSLWQSQANREKTVALWARLAERYSDEPWIGGYDLINETNWDFGAQGNQPLRSLYGQITDAIRMVDQNHIIFIEGNWFANDFSGLTPPWDDNMVYSYHKYGTYNTNSVIQWMLDIRNTHNVPIWLGETGENSNTWFTNLIAHSESENIGWSMWPLKKPGINNPLNVQVNDDYRTLLDGWRNNNLTLTEEEAFQAVMTFANNQRIGNCYYQREVVDAMFRQPYTTETLPYKRHTVQSTIFATDYDLGRNGYAYYDKDTASYQYSQGSFTSWNIGWAYRNDGVDIEACNDQLLTNGYSVGWVEDGEWMKYTIQNDSAASYTMEIRSASGNTTDARIRVLVNGTDATGLRNLPVTGGWYQWQTHDLKGVILPQGEVEVTLVFDRAGSNLNYFRFKDPVAISELPFRFVSARTGEFGNEVYITLNKEITAPGDHINASDFSFYVNGLKIAFDNVIVNPDDPGIIRCTSPETLFAGDVLRISYEGEEIMHEDQILSPFTLELIENHLVPHAAVPGRIQAENFYINNGLNLEECKDVGGGLNTSFANKGDYLDYLIYVENEGHYNVSFRVATERYNAGLSVQYKTEKGFQTLGNLKFQRTGGWQIWSTQTFDLHLVPGKYILRLLVTGEEHNLNWIELSKIVNNNVATWQENLRIYPVPATSQITIAMGNHISDPVGVQLLDITGRILYRNQFIGPEYTLSTQNYRSGFYFIKLAYRNEETLFRFMIHHS